MRRLCHRSWILVVACNLAAASTTVPHTAWAQPPAPNKTEVPQLEYVFEEVVTLGPAEHPGKTPMGERNIIPITGGTFRGPNLKGVVMAGGWDWQLSAGGCNRLKADYMLKTDDGVIINVLNQAAMCSAPSQSSSVILTSPVFEAPLGRYEWLNDGVYVGALLVTTIEGKPAVRIRMYKVH